jgi:hypothetical protein
MSVPIAWQPQTAVNFRRLRKFLRRDLFEAMMEVAGTGIGPREQVTSIGCSIKWKG